MRQEPGAAVKGVLHSQEGTSQPAPASAGQKAKASHEGEAWQRSAHSVWFAAGVPESGPEGSE